MHRLLLVASLFVLCACDSTTPSSDPGPGTVERITVEMRTSTSEFQRYDATYVNGTSAPRVFRVADSLDLEPGTTFVELDVETSTVDLVSSANWPSDSRFIYSIRGGLPGHVDVTEGTPPVIDREAEASRAALRAKTSPAVLPVVVVESADARVRGEVVLDWGVFSGALGRVRPEDADSLWFRLEMPARVTL